ncbi:MAG: OmpA family protein, partial [Proteobacteria bacterium]|nr:OmpA family protein [Pseudomonadota bacterium]
MQYAPSHPTPENILVNNSDYASGGSGGPLVSMAAPTPFGWAVPLDLSNPIPLVPSTLFHAGNVIFIKLTDIDQNVDSLVIETVTVTLSNDGTGDPEVLRLYETGPDTGVFVGYLMTTTAAATSYDGTISVTAGSSTQVSYTDSSDGTDMTTLAALIDPFGLIFNSDNGNPVDGVTVTLIDANTGLAATVFGDDGVSIYPSTITSGGTATDSGGTLYYFSPGNYRFPFVLPGNYRLDVTPPSGYEAPSVVNTADLQTLPGAPFAIVNPGSRGEAFVVNPGPALHIDYPVDPLITDLYVRKKALKSFVSHGDFLPYEVEVINGTANDITNTTLTDVLPLGFRYEKGSLKIGGIGGVEPFISPDGRTLSINIGTLATGTGQTFTYVTLVASGAKRGDAHNMARATGDGGMASNIAKATVIVKEDLMRSETIIAGQIFADACKDGAEKITVGGVRIYMEDGTSVISDKKGMFHFKGVTPGTHVVQLDVDTIPPMYEIVSCYKNNRFAGRSFSQFVDLQGGTLWRSDFHLALKARMDGEVELEMKSSFKKDEKGEKEPSFRNYSSGINQTFIIDKNTDDKLTKEIKDAIKNERIKGEKRIVDYIIPFSIGKVDVRNMRLTVLLPDGAAYMTGSSLYGNEVLEDPFIMGNSLTYNIGRGAAGMKNEVKFSAQVTSAEGYKTLVTQSLITVDTPERKNVRTPMVENILENIEEKKMAINPDIILRPHFEPLSADLGEDYKRQLDDLIELLRASSVTHIYVTGHTDSLDIRERSWNIFTDNYSLSNARAESVGRHIIDALNLNPLQLSFDGRGPDEPISTNDTEVGRALNRRVELKVESEKQILWSHLDQLKDESGLEKVETKGLRPGERWEEQKTVEIVSDFDKALRDDSPGFALLWPKEGYYPAIPSTKVIIKHDSKERVKLYLDGERVSALHYDGTIKSASGEVTKSVWLGIHLKEGENRFLSITLDSEGKEKERIERTIHYAGIPVKAEMVEEKSFLVANGKSSPVIAVKLTDKSGEPAREGLIGQFSVDPPHSSNDFFEDVRKEGITGGKKDSYRYKIEKDGIAYIKLAPTTKTGEVVLRLRLAKEEKEVRSWLTSEARDWILVGFGEGTAAYNTLNGNMTSINENDIEEDLYYDGRVALYARGRIKGEWLLTMAYDSDKRSGLEREKLHQTVDPDQYYTLYGDGSEQQHDAASARKLYLKIERGRFYALFGDYDTGLTISELSRYNRSMNGFKSEMKGEKFEYNIFASETANAFVKDEIRGDGTSGLYSLSKNNIVINSESVEIEVRDRFRSEIIISSRKLTRHVDYSIDYDEGTIFFREAVFSTDQNFNPVYIVVDYETNNSSDTSFNYGGRGAVKSLGGALTTGLSHIHEGTSGGEGDLYGLDVKANLTKTISVSGEIASTDSEYIGLSRDGKAYLAEIKQISARAEGKLYYREMEDGFGLGQQKGSEYGMRKAG